MKKIINFLSKERFTGKQFFSIIYMMIVALFIAVACCSCDQPQNVISKSAISSYKFEVTEYMKPNSYWNWSKIFCDSLYQVSEKEVILYIDGIEMRKLTQGSFAVTQNPSYGK